MRTHHTPGPWAVDKIGESTFIVTDPPRGTLDKYIAEIPNTDEEGRIPSDREREANALLIAAAPDLFAACVAFIEGWEQNLTEPMAALRLAVEKAENG